MDKNNIRIKDIAKLAGVSAGTVDRVIHNRAGVSEEARRKVMAILDEMDYKPNIIARTLVSKKNYVIATLVPDPEQDEYWEQSRQGIMQAKEEWAPFGITIQLFLFDLYNKESFKSTSKAVIESNPDGILIAPIFYKEALEFFKSCKEASIPYVMFNTYIDEALPLSFIGQDLEQSGKVGAELLHFNHKGPGTFAILHIYDDMHESINLREKEKGFKKYFEEAKNGESKIISLHLSNTDETLFESQLKELISNPELRGILITTSKGVFVVSSFLENYGKKDIKLVGYDLLEKNMYYLKNGIIDFLINQNPKRQALVGVRQLANYLLFKREISSLNLFPLEIITRQNLESYLHSEII